MTPPTAYQRDKMVDRMSNGTELEKLTAAYVDKGALTFTIPPVTPIPPVVNPPTNPPIPPVTPLPPATGSGRLELSDKWYYSGDIDFLNHCGFGHIPYNDGQNYSYGHIDSNIKFNNHNTLRADQPAGTNGTLQLWPRFSKIISDVWLRVPVKFSLGFTLGMLVAPAPSFKIIGLAHSVGNLFMSARLEAAYGYLTLYSAGKDNGVDLFTYADKIFGQGHTMFTNGAWNEFILHSRIGNNVLYNDVYWDRKLVASTVHSAMPNKTIPGFSFAEVGINYNQIRAKTQNLWFGEVDIYEGGNPWNV